MAHWTSAIIVALACSACLQPELGTDDSDDEALVCNLEDDPSTAGPDTERRPGENTSPNANTPSPENTSAWNTQPGENSPAPTASSWELGVAALGDDHFVVLRDVVTEPLRDFGKHDRFVPQQECGTVVGLRLFGVRPGTVASALGIENGDRIDSVNGHPLKTAENALLVRDELTTADFVWVELSRRGKPKTLVYEVR